MKYLSLFLFVFLLFLSTQPSISAEEEYTGIIESRPEGVAGTWVVGGNSYNATEKTKIDEEKGPLKVGACAEVEIIDGKFTEIETVSPKKCKR